MKRKKWLWLGLFTVFVHAMDVATTVYAKEKYPETKELNPFFRKIVDQKKWGILILIKSIVLCAIAVLHLVSASRVKKDKKKLEEHNREFYRIIFLSNMTMAFIVIRNIVLILRKRCKQEE